MEAILVAGGQGKRLGAVAQGLPKALVPLAGRPLSSYMLERLVKSGIERVIVNCAQGTSRLFRERLSEYVSGVAFDVVEEPEPLGRGGGVRFAASRLVQPGPFLVVYGDELLDLDLAAFERQHVSSAAALTITSAPLTTPFGVLEIDPDGRVLDFREAPTLPDHWVNVGVYMLEREAVQELPEKGDAEHEVFPRLAKAGKLWAYRHDGIWLTVNTAKDLEIAEQRFADEPSWLGVTPPRQHRRLAQDIRRALDRVRRHKPAPLASAAEAAPSKP